MEIGNSDPFKLADIRLVENKISIWTQVIKEIIDVTLKESSIGSPYTIRDCFDWPGLGGRTCNKRKIYPKRTVIEFKTMDDTRFCLRRGFNTNSAEDHGKLDDQVTFGPCDII